MRYPGDSVRTGRTLPRRPGGAGPRAPPRTPPKVAAPRGGAAVKSQAVDRGIKLLVVQGRPQGKALLFPPGEHLFGRGAECQIRANSDWVSRQHCLLRDTPDGAFLRDLGSRNGTLVNGERLIGERRLQPGDQLQVGPLVFQFCPDDTPTPEPL